MADKTFRLFYPTTDLIDPMGSIIINTNTQMNPNFEWVYVNSFKGVGLPNISNPVTTSLKGYKDTTSYKIKFLEYIKKHNNVSSYIGNSACLSSPNSIACNGVGPYYVNDRRYYIDFRVLYFVNTSRYDPDTEDETDYLMSNPIFSVDTSRCDQHYGIFIATPKIKQSVINDNLPDYLLATPGSQDNNMFTDNLPTYANEIGKFNLNIKYRLTALYENNQSSFMDDIELTPENIVLALSNLLNYGQSSIVSVNENNGPIVLRPQSTVSSSFTPQSVYPFIIFRYISENAPTRQVSLNFSFSPYL